MNNLIVVFSYRHEYIEMGACGCCVDGGSCEDFEVEAFYSDQEVADWIARRIQEAPKANFSNLVLQNADLGAMKDYRWDTQMVAAVGIDSIHVPEYIYVPDPDQTWVDDEDSLTTQTEEAQNRRDQLCERIRKLVAAELKILEAKKQEREDEVKRLQKEKQEKQKLERDRKEYERLQKQFEEQKG